MADFFHFHPYYNQWDDGTIGMKSIAEGEKAAAKRALKWFRERNEWDIPRPMDDVDVLRDPMGDKFYSPRNLPDILQPKTLRVGVQVRGDMFNRESQRFGGFLERYHNMPAHEQAEASFDYPFRKSELDYKRLALARTKKDLSNAEWLAFRDKQIEELKKTNRDFSFYTQGIEEYAQDFLGQAEEHRAINDRLRTVRLEKQGLLSELEFIKLQLDGFTPRQHSTDVLSKKYNEINSKIDEIEAKESGVLDNLDRTTRKIERIANEKGFRTAHVEASNELTKAGLNRKGFPLAGRLLSAPGIAADVSQIAAIAGVGPMKNYDNTGASYTNDEVVKVDEVKRVRSEVEELAAYHPDNAKNHPEISDLDRINFFRKRGANEQVLSGLPGYKSWKAEQVQAEAEITKKLEMLNLNR